MYTHQSENRIGVENWYLACHKAGKHNAFKAQMFLSESGIPVFIPQMFFRQPRSDRPGQYRKKLELLFPGYLFIYFNVEEHSFPKILCCPGISHFVRFGGAIKPLNDMIIDELMQVTKTIGSAESGINECGHNLQAVDCKKSNNITELQREEFKLIVQEKNSETRSLMFFDFIETIVNVKERP
ncbi:transcription termination/antitermination NusG family protein [Enterobacter roggenkampii]|uniref:transcription termination/antitermination NusG family protein n=1 Tax=Enterobacter roggenkampii TaxID=1812935 RepID=UPI00084C06EE|nr:transcription termination/antitermination NusG family protein [Enterobacter roggenkampii]AOP98014.1 hypothetical protein BFV67_22850 [Enterobacter roggenkampii]QWZ75387.1 hypothetical protein I6L60_23115 [Enterobacter roggenkampii]QWZ75474.1 hypothetical protein I6L60_23200 [Enterobacter roggenkampii]